MTDAPQPTSGSLEAKIIRACTVHRTCPLTCRERTVEDLGEIASFVTRQDVPDDSFLNRLKEGLGLWRR